MTDECRPAAGAADNTHHWLRDRKGGMWVALWDKGTWYWCGSTSGETAAEVAHHSVYHLPTSPDDATERARLERENARLREALEFYANPEIYKPHPHGPAFERRDVSFVAKEALNDR